MIKLTDKKRCTYGRLLIDVSKALLTLAGFSGDIGITLAWQSPVPHDDLPAVQAAIAKRELDISNTTLQRELGYDPEEEQQLSQSEDELRLARAQALMEQQGGLPQALPGVKPLPGQTPAKPPVAPVAQPGQPASGGQK